MYCQSNERLSSPRPSLPEAPPNKFVKTSRVLLEAFCEAKQKMLNPFKSGNMYEGMTEQVLGIASRLMESLTVRFGSRCDSLHRKCYGTGVGQ
jgi:hypothetical protein